MSVTTELVERIWARDPTVWTGADEAQWLGWLDEPARMLEQLDEVLAFANDVISAGAIDDFVVLGMGGSSLAPEVTRLLFDADRFHVLDTTHPKAIRALELKIPPPAVATTFRPACGATSRKRPTSSVDAKAAGGIR